MNCVTNTNTVSCLSSNVIKKIQNILKLLKTKEEFERCRKNINKIIIIINKCIKQQKNTFNKFENLFKLEGNLTLLKTYREIIKNELKRSEIVSRSGYEGEKKKKAENKLVWQNIESVFNSRIQTGTIINKANFKDPKLFLQAARRIFFNKIKSVLLKFILKVNVIFSCEFILPHTGKTDVKHFTTTNNIIDKSTNLKKWYEHNVEDKLLNKLEEFQERDSGWALYRILYLKVNINKYEPINGGSYIDLPPDIKRKQAVINVRNNDNYCFLWAIVSALYPVAKNPNRTTAYPHFSEVLNYEGLNFPLNIKDIGKFEDMNQLTINVYAIEEVKSGKNIKNIIVPVKLTTKQYEKKYIY